MTSFGLLFAIGLRAAPGFADVSMPALMTLAQLNRLAPTARTQYLEAIQRVLDTIEKGQAQRLSNGWTMPDPSRPAACLADGSIFRLKANSSRSTCIDSVKGTSETPRDSTCSRVRTSCPDTFVVQLGPHQLRCHSPREIPCNPLIYGFKSTATEYDPSHGRWTASAAKPHRGPFCRRIEHPGECAGHAQTEFIPQIVRELKVESAYDAFATHGLAMLCAGPASSRPFDDQTCRTLGRSVEKFLDSYRPKPRKPVRLNLPWFPGRHD